MRGAAGSRGAGTPPMAAPGARYVCAYQPESEDPAVAHLNPVLIVTGTSSGIGLATAVQAAAAGFTTVATMRDTERAAPLREAARAAGVEVDVRRLDVVDARSVQECVADVASEYGRIDAVVNNAGAGHVGTVEHESVDEIRQVMEVNFFGVVTVTREALPHLRASGGRLVTVTSIGGAVGQPFNEAYCAAKFAVEGFMESLAPVAATVGVTVVVVEPGAVASQFVANVGADVPALFAAAGPYEPAMRGYLDHVMGEFGSAQSSEEAAAVIVDALTSASPPFRVQTSAQAQEFVGAKLRDLDGSAVTAMTGTWVGS